MQHEFVREVLEALVSGYRAREGLKDRFRSLNEYEIARRTGITTYSYAQYDTSPERAEVQDALSLLEREGLVSAGQASGRYASFVPTSAGTAAAASLRPAAVPGEDSAAEADAASPPPASEKAMSEPQPPPIAYPPQVERKLDEIIQLLRSIDRKLADRD